MKAPPHRIAALALVLLVLAGAGAWWWQARPQALQPSSKPETAERTDAPSEVVRGASELQRATGLEAAFLRMAGIDIADAQAAERCTTDMDAATLERARQLAARNDAASRLAYALTAPFTLERSAWENPPSGHAMQVYEAVRSNMGKRLLAIWAQSPDNPDARRLAALNCGAGQHCIGIEQAQQEAEPENAVTWLVAMEMAKKRGDDAGIAEAFANAAQASHYDRHGGSAQLAVQDAYADMPLPASCRHPGVARATQAMRGMMPGVMHEPGEASLMLANMAETWMQPTAMALSAYCVQPPEDRVAQCRHVYGLMAAGGRSLLEQSIALSGMVRTTHGMPEAAQWRERYRQWHWMMQRYMDGPMGLAPEAYATNEVAAVRDALQAQGKWPPPADWLPDDETARSLILTGKPPE